MAEPQFGNDDDLPRTLRRERDAQREAREREAQLSGAATSQAAQPYSGAYSEYGNGYIGPQPLGVVNRFEVPFGHLMWFFIKAVLAAIPALILLTALLYGGGQLLKTFAPGFRQFEIIVRTPDMPAAKTTEPTKAAPPAAATPAKR